MIATPRFVSPDEIRVAFSRAMSDMYRREVPQYGTLSDLVAEVNAAVLRADPAMADRIRQSDQLDRISDERHGAIRLGTAAELATMRRLFAVMGMRPVGYYDLSEAGIPVHSTAFRPVTDAALRRNPFRVFTSLLRLELIDDPELRDEAERTLAARDIFTPMLRTLIRRHETQGGLGEDEASRFVREALETFRWHGRATVDRATYDRLHDAHRLIADVVSFPGPHINHLTPRTLDIDKVQQEMPRRGIAPKAVVEGPPRRQCPILLRQTSFKALEESVRFVDAGGEEHPGTHTARFGEIEQRGVALTPDGRELYDKLLIQARETIRPNPDGSNAAEYARALESVFAEFPDDWETLRRDGLAYFRYRQVADGDDRSAADDLSGAGDEASVNDRIVGGKVVADPITYEDFLPVSAAGIFQSNLGDETRDVARTPNQDAFERDLGVAVADPFEIYASLERESLESITRDGGPAR